MKKMRKHIRSLKDSNEMVSDIVGTIVLLGITVMIFSSLYIMVLSYPISADPAKVTIVGTIEGANIILEHRGGEALGMETIIPISIAGVKQLIDGRTPIVRDLLIDSNNDGLWNIGERLVYKFNYSLTNLEAVVIAIDVESNNLVLTGTLDIHPESDIGVKSRIDPVTDNSTILRIKATNYRGDMNATNITIECKIPDEMIYVSHDLSQGIYDTVTGLWNIDQLNVTKSATLNISMKVNLKPTQLALLIDGSSSIIPTDWNITLDGIALAITNGYIPHNEQVELTLIQFGGWTDSRSWAQVELGGPIVLNNLNYMTVASNIQAIPQLGGGTAMSCAFRLAADVLSGDPYGYLAGTPFAGMASRHSDWERQVVNLVTDGQPNILYIHDERYAGSWPGAIPNEFILGKADTEEALTYFKSLVPIVEAEGDEIDAEAVGVLTDQVWLRDYIVRPQPGYDNWPPTGPGWVRYVDNYTEFANTTGKNFEFMFKRITIIVEILSSTPIDPNLKNNEANIILIQKNPKADDTQTYFYIIN